MKKNKPFFDKDALLWAFGGISAGAILCLALAPHYLGQIQDSAFLAGVKAAQTITPLPSPEERPSLPRLEVATLRDVRAGVHDGRIPRNSAEGEGRRCTAPMIDCNADGERNGQLSTFGRGHAAGLQICR
jgi:hypothetical protein